MKYIRSSSRFSDFYKALSKVYDCLRGDRVHTNPMHTK